MSKPEATLKKYIVTKRLNPNEKFNDFRKDYDVLHEIPVVEKVYPPLTFPKVGEVVTINIPGAGDITCTTLVGRKLGMDTMGYCNNGVILYLTESHAHLCSTPPVMHRSDLHNQQIGILLIATGKYTKFVDALLNSAAKYLFPGHTLTFFVFTDGFKQQNVTNKKLNVKIIPWPHHAWPGSTLYRYKAFTEHSIQLARMNFLYYCDVDMKFVDTVGNEALADSVATLHPGYVDPYGTGTIITVGTPERNPKSKAYLPKETKNRYFAGGFNGGSATNFLKMAEVLDKNIDEDKANNIVAVYHDESHMNHYFHHNPPALVLNPGYCYPEEIKNLPYPKKLIALLKDHKEVRKA